MNTKEGLSLFSKMGDFSLMYTTSDDGIWVTCHKCKEEYGIGHLCTVQDAMIAAALHLALCPKVRR